jgi:Tn3 transposase DDE domain
MESQLPGLGLILNCVTLWNTHYLDAALNQLRAHGYPIRDEDIARLSPFVHAHLNVTGTLLFRPTRTARTTTAPTRRRRPGMIRA